MFLTFLDSNSNHAGINIDDLNYYTINSSGDVRVYVGVSSLSFVFGNGTSEKTKFLDLVKSKKVLALDNTSTDVFIIPSKIQGWNNQGSTQTNIYLLGDNLYINDSTDIATFQSYMDAVSK